VNQGPRRRRSEYDDGGDRGGGLPIFPLVIAVILLGLLLGGVLAHFFGGGPAVQVPTPMPSITPLSTPIATETPVATPSPTPRPTPKRTPRPTSTPTPSARPTATLSSAPASAVIIITPAPVASLRPAATPKPATPKPAVTLAPSIAKTTAPRSTRAPRPTASPTPLNPQSATGSSGASAVVRAYLSAMMHGNRALATSYLESGVPTETFLQSGTIVNDVSATPNADGTYRVTADVVDPDNQEYFITFAVAPGAYGMRITSHYSIKPH